MCKNGEGSSRAKVGGVAFSDRGKRGAGANNGVGEFQERDCTGFGRGNSGFNFGSQPGSDRKLGESAQDHQTDGLWQIWF